MTQATTSARIGTAVGDLAPDFTLPDQHGNPVTLSSFRGKQSVVLFFYPKSFSGGCTAEACAFRDSHEVFKEAGAAVIGISTDSVDTQHSFSQKHQLMYTLLSDASGELQKTYQIPRWLGIFRGRVTFVIDKQGIVRHVFNSQMMINSHISEAIKTLKQLS